MKKPEKEFSETDDLRLEDLSLLWYLFGPEGTGASERISRRFKWEEITPVITINVFPQSRSSTPKVGVCLRPAGDGEMEIKGIKLDTLGRIGDPFEVEEIDEIQRILNFDPSVNHGKTGLVISLFVEEYLTGKYYYLESLFPKGGLTLRNILQNLKKENRNWSLY